MKQVNPFFVRFLESNLDQEMTEVKGGARVTNKYPSDSDEGISYTKKYPSDNDESVVLNETEAIRVTMKYPSDKDEGLTMKYPSDGDDGVIA